LILISGKVVRQYSLSLSLSRQTLVSTCDRCSCSVAKVSQVVGSKHTMSHFPVTD